MVRRIIGLVLLGLGAWLFWEGLQAVLAFTSRGGPLMSALMEPPTSLIRLVGSGLILLGGLLIVLKTRSGGLAAFIGAIIFAGLGGLLAAAGTDLDLWLDEVIQGGTAFVLATVTLFLKRT